jgi:hypothetical protein
MTTSIHQWGVGFAEKSGVIFFDRGLWGNSPTTIYLNINSSEQLYKEETKKTYLCTSLRDWANPPSEAINLSLILYLRRQISWIKLHLKSWPFISENFGTAKKPNMPTSCDHYLHEEWFVKTPSGCSNNGLKVITSFPSNLQIMPDAITEVTLKN